MKARTCGKKRLQAYPIPRSASRPRRKPFSNIEFLPPPERRRAGGGGQIMTGTP
jgi:hypothetical protein